MAVFWLILLAATFWAGRLVERWWWMKIVAPEIRGLRDKLRRHNEMVEAWRAEGSK